MGNSLPFPPRWQADTGVTYIAPRRVTLSVNNATDEVYVIARNSSLSTGSGYA